MKQDFLKPTEALVPSWKQTAFYQEGGQLLGGLGAEGWSITFLPWLSVDQVLHSYSAVRRTDWFLNEPSVRGLGEEGLEQIP